MKLLKFIRPKRKQTDVTPEQEVMEQYERLIEQVDQLKTYEDRFYTMIKIQNRMFNHLKADHEKEEILKTHMRLLKDRMIHNNYQN